MNKSPEQGGIWISPTFEEIASECPWKTATKCEVLHAAGRYSGDACSEEHCAILYWFLVKVGGV